ncbi:hypothetical protein BDZ97DRAFT_1791957 [Flammula alnicola]|nr:hypothetical protein BDZ97DRAFT_1791957 [Flammula alnicola]
MFPVLLSRICSGRFLAASSAWIILASMITVHDISQPIDRMAISSSPCMISLPPPFCAFQMLSLISDISLSSCSSSEQNTSTDWQ